MNFSINLKTAREKKGYTKAKMATLLNIPYTSYNNFENGREPKVEMILRIARILNISLFDLIGNEGISKAVKNGEIEWFSDTEKNNDSDIMLIRKYRLLDELDKKVVNDLIDTLSSRTSQPKEFIALQPPLLIPYYGHIASAGTGQYVFDDIPPEMIEIENEMDNMHVDFAIGVNGDSMEPTYRDGDTLLIKKQSEIHIGEVGIFMIGGEAFVKELGDGVLISHNKKYKDIHINDSVICLGKVISKHIS